MKKAFRSLSRAILRRRHRDNTYNALMSLNDRQLEDIGIPRGRIPEALRSL